MKQIENITKELEKMIPDNSDHRSETSRENGKLGGRKSIPVADWALKFVSSKYSRDLNGENFYTLRFHSGVWYDYRNDYWHQMHKQDLKSEIVGFLQKNSDIERISGPLSEDMILNLNSSEICNLHSEKYQIPCFITSGKNAGAWMPMKNCVLNIEKAAEALGDNLDLPADAKGDNSPDLFSTYGLPYSFDEKADCPKFKKYLSEVQPDEDNRKCLQMLAGLSLVPDCRYNVAFFLYGEAGTGKSVFLNILSELIGKDNICSVPLAKLADRFGLAPLTEKLLNVVGEMPVMPESGHFADMESMFKSITSGDIIIVERKGIDSWKARPIARMVFATNTLPSFTDRSDGVWDRIRIIPFNQRIRNTSKQNTNLSNELLEELPGIFIWALHGLAMLRKQKNFPECKLGSIIKEEHRSSCDHERTFLTEYVEAETGSFCSSDELYKKYQSWMTDNGCRAVGAPKFKAAVARHFPLVYEDNIRIDGNRMRRFHNIRLK